MLNEDKLAIKDGSVAIKCKLIVKAENGLPEITLTEENCVKDWTYSDDRYVPQQGFIGQFVARTLSGNLQNISDDFNIENRKIELLLGIVNRSTKKETWYNLGNFLITNPEDDEVRDNTKFEAMDYTKFFNQTFDGDYTDNVFTVSYNTKMENKETVTALWLAKYTCAQVDVELGSDAFTNNDYEIDINPFRNNETCRDVMKEISKLAYSWVRIGWDNKCYIDFGVKQTSSVDQYNTFMNDHYYTLETKKEVYGPINKVVVGMSNIDGESHANQDPSSIASNGEHAIYIYDNPLTYTFEHRKRANAKGNVLFGLSYTQLTCETIGFPWLTGTELIRIDDMDGKPLYTYAFNKTITYTGHIKSTIDSMGESQIEETLSYESDVVRNARNAFINVNKQEGSIHMLSEKIEVVEKEINPTKDESGSEIIIEDASNNPLINLEIEGKSTQATRSGKNLIDKNLFNFGSPYYYCMYLDNPTEIYTLSVKLKENGISKNIYIGFSENNLSPLTNYSWLLNNGTLYGTNTNDGFRYINNFSNNVYRKYVIIYLNGNTLDDLFDNYYIQLQKGNFTNYEPYGVMPSPNYPSEIESVGYENLWNSDLEVAEYDANGNKITTTVWVTNKNTIEVKPNTTYTISQKETPSQYRIIYFNNDTFLSRESNTQNTTKGYKSHTFVTPNNCNKIYIQFRSTIEVINTGTYVMTDDSITNTMLTEGITKHSYIPYGKYAIEVKNTGKNLFDENKYFSMLNNSNGIYTGNSSLPYVTYGSSNGGLGLIFDSNTSYTISFVAKNTSSVVSTFSVAIRYTDNTTQSLIVSTTDWKTYKISTDESKSISMIYFSYFNNAEFSIKEFIISKTSDYTGYEPYQENTSLFVLDQPLRSLSNGTKDILYIKNDKLYVDRKVGSIVLDGSESWGIIDSSNVTYVMLTNLMKQNSIARSSHFKFNYVTLSNLQDGEFTTLAGEGYALWFKNQFSTLDEFKTWLSTHNTQVDYELATPVTEELGEIEMLKTLKGYNKISTTDNLLPIINLTYVRDTILADYVENHVAELKITESEIKSSVKNVSTSVNGLHTTVNRVEEITNDNSQVLNIISTNIDRTSGEVREVTTTTGFTFNKDGMTIDDGSGFRAEHRADGTYYKDGTSTVGQYTKDGSKQKDLQLFGVYSYGMKDIDDIPRFIGQLYEDENGEECFGHFINI